MNCDNCAVDDKSKPPVEGSKLVSGDFKVHHLSLYKDDGMTYELSVPTCSYRMGVPEMGFTVAMIGRFVLASIPNYQVFTNFFLIQNLIHFLLL